MSYIIMKDDTSFKIADIKSYGEITNPQDGLYFVNMGISITSIFTLQEQDCNVTFAGTNYIKKVVFKCGLTIFRSATIMITNSENNVVEGHQYGTNLKEDGTGTSYNTFRATIIEASTFQIGIFRDSSSQYYNNLILTTSRTFTSRYVFTAFQYFKTGHLYYIPSSYHISGDLGYPLKVWWSTWIIPSTVFFPDNDDYLIKETIFPGEISEPELEYGDFDDTQDDIDFEDLPTESSQDSGFITIYKPTLSKLIDLSNFMWSDDFVDVVKKMFGDPIDTILSLSIIPVNPTSTTSQSLKVGFIDTNITMALVDSQYMKVNCGSVILSEYWGSALDYSPYTKVSIYLPYIGIRTLNVDDVMKKTIEVEYSIDILTGSLVANIKCNNSVLYVFNGNCISNLPLSGRDFSQLIGNVLGTVGSVGVAVASGGATAVASGVAMANNVMNSKPTVQKSGNISSNCGMLARQKPYLIIERPKQSLAQNYNKFVGYPCNVTYLLSTLNGYTEIESIHMNNLKCTSNEADEIISLLKGGVLL